LDELARQLVRAPAERRAEQVRRAERLHDEIEPDASYPFDYLVYRITGFRAETDETVLLIGEAVAADLRLLIDTLSRSIRITPSPGESLDTLDALARRLGVSTKTIERWRKDGLRWRWTFDPQRGKSVITISLAALAAFRERSPHRIEQARGFTRMSASQRAELIAAARQMAANHPAWSLNRIARRLAQRFGRAHETIRQTLQQHDARHPDQPIFQNAGGPLTERDARVIARARRRGIAVNTLAEHFGKSPSTVRAAHARYRLAQLRKLDLRGLETPLFERPDAEQVYRHSARAHAADRDRGAVSSVPVTDLPGGLRPLYRQTTLDAATQRHLFRRMHYLRFKARCAIAAMSPSQPRVAELEQARALIDAAAATRDRLIRANLPVVLSVAQRHRLSAEAPGEHLIDLLEVGNDELIEAVEAFDPFTGQSRAFDAYLTNRLLRRFTRATTARPRARRREEASEVRDRLLRAAAQRGVHLTDDV
jgi:transposase